MVRSWQGAAQGSVFTDPRPLYRARQDGQGSLSAGDLHIKAARALEAASPRVHPPLWEAPLHPLQHRLWSGLPGPCLSPGHPVSPPWALTSCPSALKAALLLSSALLTSPPLSSSLPPQGSAPCPVSLALWNRSPHCGPQETSTLGFPGGASDEEPVCRCRRPKR